MRSEILKQFPKSILVEGCPLLRIKTLRKPTKNEIKSPSEIQLSFRDCILAQIFICNGFIDNFLLQRIIV